MRRYSPGRGVEHRHAMNAKIAEEIRNEATRHSAAVQLRFFGAFTARSS
jgi:hypothetical protein